MRKQGSVFEYKPDRQKDLMRAFREQLESAEFIFLPEILARTVKSEAKRFWVSEERAVEVVRHMMKGKKPKIRRSTTIRMFEEITQRTKKALSEHPDWGFQKAVAWVIRQPAPEFYITPESAEIILHRYRHERDKN